MVQKSQWAQIGLINYFTFHEIAAKVLVEGTLFFVNLAVMRLYIFAKDNSEGKF